MGDAFLIFKEIQYDHCFEQTTNKLAVPNNNLPPTNRSLVIYGQIDTS